MIDTPNGRTDTACLELSETSGTLTPGELRPQPGPIIIRPGFFHAHPDTTLTSVEQRIIDFAGLRWKHQGAQFAAIRDIFACSSARYYQRLNHLIDQPAAAAYAPQTVRTLHTARLRRRGAWEVKT